MEYEEEATNPMIKTHLCTSCYLLGKESYMLPLKQFGVHKEDNFFKLHIYHKVNGRSACNVSEAQEHIHNTPPEILLHIATLFVLSATKKGAGRRRLHLIHMAAQHATILLMQVFGHKIC